MPDSSNPTLAITQASVRGDSARLTVSVDNPSDHDLTLRKVEYSLLYGPLPVAAGSWDVNEPLPRKSSVQFTRTVGFTSPALDPDAKDVELTGRLHFEGGGDMAITEADFKATGAVRNP